MGGIAFGGGGGADFLVVVEKMFACRYCIAGAASHWNKKAY
jgi:hypothetical protein